MKRRHNKAYLPTEVYTETLTCSTVGLSLYYTQSVNSLPKKFLVCVCVCVCVCVRCVEFARAEGRIIRFYV